MADISDDFSGTLANWTESKGSGWSITNNRLDAADVQAGNYAWLSHNTALGGSDQYAKITFVAINAGDYYGLVLRCSDQTASADCYIFLMTEGSSNATQVAAFVNGAFDGDLVVSSAITWADGDVCGCSVTGTGTDTVLSIWQNPVGATPSEWGAADVSYQLDGTDTNLDIGIHVGQAQWSAEGQTEVFDDFEASQIVVTGSSVINNVIIKQLMSGGL